MGSHSLNKLSEELPFQNMFSAKRTRNSRCTNNLETIVIAIGGVGVAVSVGVWKVLEDISI